MLLGLPIVASNVGGVSDMLVHNEEGYTYQHDAPYMLAYYICRLFNNEAIMLDFSKRAREHALCTHDREKNVKALLQIYEVIMKNNNHEN